MEIDWEKPFLYISLDRVEVAYVGVDPLDKESRHVVSLRRPGGDSYTIRVNNEGFDRGGCRRIANTPPAPEVIPWTQDTVPLNAWYREKRQAMIWSRCDVIGPTGLTLGEEFADFPTLLNDYEHTLGDRDPSPGGKLIWLPCGTEAK